MRQIIVTLTVANSVASDQCEYAVTQALYQQGVPINPMTQDVQYGTLTREDLSETKRRYTWEGEDRRQ